MLEDLKWNRCEQVERAFVAWRHPLPSPACYAVIRPTDHVALSVVIPTRDGDRNGCLANLLKQAFSQQFTGYELIMVKGDPRQGRAINVGAELAKGRYLMTLDDDTALPDRRTFAKLVGAMEGNPRIGIAGGNNVVPRNAPSLVKRAMREIPRRSWATVSVITESDLAEHPCMIMRTAEFKAIGGENELLPRGLDPYLRQAFRLTGKRVVIVPGVVYHHLPPDSLTKLVKQFFRNGCQAAFTNRLFPQWVIETPEGHGAFNARMPLPKRLLRFALRMCRALVDGKPHPVSPWSWKKRPDPRTLLNA